MKKDCVDSNQQSASLPRQLRENSRPVLLGPILFALLLCLTAWQGAAQSPEPDWKARVAQTLPLLGHRNWVLIVDSAYPLQTSSGIETIETNADQIEAVQHVLDAIGRSAHVRPLVYMDAELPFVTDQDAPGASAYRAQIGKTLQGKEIQSLPHDRVIAMIDEAGKTFHVLVLKTNMTIPYTSVFLRLDCKYWSADAERRLRQKMHGATSK